MALDAPIRIFTLLTVLWAGLTFDISRVYNFVICFAFAHLFLSIYFARKKIVAITQSPRNSILAMGVLWLSVLLVVVIVPLIVVFAPHHVFSETYAVSERNTLICSSQGLNASRLLLCGMSYIFATRDSPSFHFIGAS